MEQLRKNPSRWTLTDQTPQLSFMLVRKFENFENFVSILHFSASAAVKESVGRLKILIFRHGNLNNEAAIR